MAADLHLIPPGEGSICRRLQCKSNIIICPSNCICKQISSPESTRFDPVPSPARSEKRKIEEVYAPAIRNWRDNKRSVTDIQEEEAKKSLHEGVVPRRELFKRVRAETLKLCLSLSNIDLLVDTPMIRKLGQKVAVEHGLNEFLPNNQWCQAIQKALEECRSAVRNSTPQIEQNSSCQNQQRTEKSSNGPFMQINAMSTSQQAFHNLEPSSSQKLVVGPIRSSGPFRESQRQNHNQQSTILRLLQRPTSSSTSNVSNGSYQYQSSDQNVVHPAYIFEENLEEQSQDSAYFTETINETDYHHSSTSDFSGSQWETAENSDESTAENESPNLGRSLDEVIQRVLLTELMRKEEYIPVPDLNIKSTPIIPERHRNSIRTPESYESRNSCNEFQRDYRDTTAHVDRSSLTSNTQPKRQRAPQTYHRQDEYPYSALEQSLEPRILHDFGRQNMNPLTRASNSGGWVTFPNAPPQPAPCYPLGNGMQVPGSWSMPRQPVMPRPVLKPPSLPPSVSLSDIPPAFAYLFQRN